MDEWSPIWRVDANILNKQSRTADKGWSSSLGLGRGANNSSPYYEIDKCAWGMGGSFGTTSAIKKRHEILYIECKEPE